MSLPPDVANCAPGDGEQPIGCSKDIQPSGHCDFTNIESLLLKLHFKDILDVSHTNVLRFYTNELRVLRVLNGKAQLL